MLNWDKRPEVLVDLKEVLKPGQRFRIVALKTTRANQLSRIPIKDNRCRFR